MNDKKEMLETYMKKNVAPILVDFIKGKNLKGATIVPASVNVTELNGHYEGADFVPPKWYEEIVNTKTTRMLVIDNIDTIAKEEQLKFGEILKYRKVSTFNLPKNCIIIVTASEVNKDKINEEIFSLVARI